MALPLVRALRLPDSFGDRLEADWPKLCTIATRTILAANVLISNFMRYLSGSALVYRTGFHLVQRKIYGKVTEMLREFSGVKAFLGIQRCGRPRTQCAPSLQ